MLFVFCLCRLVMSLPFFYYAFAVFVYPCPCLSSVSALVTSFESVKCNGCTCYVGLLFWCLVNRFRCFYTLPSLFGPVPGPLLCVGCTTCSSSCVSSPRSASLSRFRHMVSLSSILDILKFSWKYNSGCRTWSLWLFHGEDFHGGCVFSSCFACALSFVYL